MSAELPFPLVQATWKKAMSLEGDHSFGHNFYKNLFTDYPILKETTFKGVAINNQKMNLPKSITTVLGLLTDMPKAIEALVQLGMRHVAYDAYTDAGYTIVGGNVIKTLGMILGADFTEEAKAEWIALYGVIQKTCVDAGYSDRALPFWKRLYKRRTTEFKKLLLGAGEADPDQSRIDAFAAKVSKATGANFAPALSNIIKTLDAAIEQQSSTPIRAAGAALAKAGGVKVSDFAGLAEAIVSNKLPEGAANPYEKMVADFFVLHLQGGFEGKLYDDSPVGRSETKKDTSCGCGCVTCTCKSGSCEGCQCKCSKCKCCASCSSCSSPCCTGITIAAIVAVVGIAGWFLLKKKQ